MKKPLGTILSALCFVIGLVLLLTGLSPLWQTPPAPVPVDAVITVTPTNEMLDSFAPDTAVGELDRDVTRANGDLNLRTIHLAMGFATGGFGQDPVAQRAMSEIGQQFLSHLLVPGDTISMFGFEKHLGPSVWNLPFGPQSGPQLAAVWGQLKPGEGGIDYNEAIVSALPNLKPQNNHNTVLVLIGPWDTSQSAASDRTPPKFADLSPALLKQYGLIRMPPFKISYHQKSENQNRAIYLTILLPTYFSSEILSPSRQSCLAQADTAPVAVPSLAPDEAGALPAPSAQDAPHANGPVVGTGLLFLVVGVVLLLLPTPTAGKITVVVGGGSQDFYGPWKMGEVICRIAGNGLPTDAAKRTIQISSAPPVVLAEIQQGTSGPVIRSEHLLTAAGGQAGQGGYNLRKGPRQTVRIEGKSSIQPDLPPTPFSVSMEISLQ